MASPAGPAERQSHQRRHLGTRLSVSLRLSGLRSYGTALHLLSLQEDEAREVTQRRRDESSNSADGSPSVCSPGGSGFLKTVP